MSVENAKRLESAVITSLTLNGIPTEEDILSLARQLRAISIYEVNDEEFDAIIKRLHASLRISMGLGTKVTEDYTPWLFSRKPEIDPYYWNRYVLYLRQTLWAPKVIATLDQVTDEILDLLGNPAGTEGWARRGLVMGDVQSGKTSNYTGLICKAADAGYRVVILLTGTLESLRRQTQERLDAGFVGLDSSGIVTRDRKTREVGVGLISPIRTAGVFTSTQRDFSIQMSNQLGFRLSTINEPILLVVKKHKSILENLTNWLQTYNADQQGRIDAPMLLIDDEADNASVNTRGGNDATAINKAIRGLLKLFTRSSYVGFTATPFANVFIDPDTENEMIGNDLFPRDFIYALEAPTNYIGPKLIFGDESSLNCLREIDDAESAFPRSHKADLQISGIPSTLLIAVRSFLLANAIMDIRGGLSRHRSMLVNVSHYTAVQEQVKELLGDVVRKTQEDIRNYSKLSQAEAFRNSTLRDLHETWKQEYSNTGIPWAEVQKALNNAVLPVEVRSVNQRTGAASLDYARHKENGLRLIAVGGNSLSRGLTLEGLCVSYFFRNTQMYDALLQMGRWFGYREGYFDLCRIWMSDEAINWYAHISDAAEELRAEIRRMQLSKLKPIDFGLKVRAHPDSLLITARNKMRYSEEVERIISVSHESLETSRLLSDKSSIQANANVARRFVKNLHQENLHSAKSDFGNPLWRKVPKRFVVEMLKQFSGHPLHISFQPKDLAEFLDRTDESKLDFWDVVIPNGQGATEDIEGIAVNLQKRRLEVEPAKRSILVSERKMRVGSRGVEREGLSPELVASVESIFISNPENAGKNVSDAHYRVGRERPLLLLHFLQGMIIKRNSEREVQSEEPFVVDAGPLFAIGLSFPEFKDSTENRRVRYRVNLVEWRNMFASEPSDDEDEDYGEP